MKTLILILFTTVCFSQSNENLLKYVEDYKDVKNINVSTILKEINYARLGELQKPYRLYLEVEKDTLCYFTILISPMVKDERRLIFNALDEIVKESLMFSEVGI